MKIIEILITTDNEDDILKNISDDVDYAILYTKGHEFIDKEKFLNAIKKTMPFFIAGHILDYEEKYNAYYSIHEQCYVINIKIYKDLGCPSIGKQIEFEEHTQISPIRSQFNFHDFHTPDWVKPGVKEKTYKHKAHGWNILSIAFLKDLPIIVFNEEMRSSKTYQYDSK